MKSDTKQNKGLSILATGGALVAVTFITGCYGSAPPEPPKVAVRVLPGEKIDVDSKSETKMEDREKKIHTCPQGHSPGSPSCLVTTTTETVPVTRTWATATYGGKALTLAQLVALSDPKWDAKMNELNDHRAACEGANTPRYIGLAGIIGGLVAMGVGAGMGKGAGTVVAIGGLVALGGGIVSYAAGYIGFGGARCNEANAMYHALPSTTETHARGNAEVDGMKKLADDFNGRVEAPRTEAPRTEAPRTETPRTEPPRTESRRKSGKTGRVAP